MTVVDMDLALNVCSNPVPVQIQKREKPRISRQIERQSRQEKKEKKKLKLIQSKVNNLSLNQKNNPKNGNDKSEGTFSFKWNTDKKGLTSGKVFKKAGSASTVNVEKKSLASTKLLQNSANENFKNKVNVKFSDATGKNVEHKKGKIEIQPTGNKLTKFSGIINISDDGNKIGKVVTNNNNNDVKIVSPKKSSSEKQETLRKLPFNFKHGTQIPKSKPANKIFTKRTGSEFNSGKDNTQLDKSNTVSFESDDEFEQIEKSDSPPPEKSFEPTKKFDKAKQFKGKTSSLFRSVYEVPNIGKQFVRPIEEKVFSGSKFSDLPIHPFSVQNLNQNLNLTELTNVQKKAIPVLLNGSDAMIRSQTGSGKTLAYALPIIETLQAIQPPINRSDGVKALIIVPTRELALQTYELLRKLIKPFTRIVPGYLVGGEKRKSEKARLRKGITVLVGTPGRVLDHVQNTCVLKLDTVKCLVLDEADRMLDMGYEKDIRSLIQALDSHKVNASYDPVSMFRKTLKANSEASLDANPKHVYYDCDGTDAEITKNDTKDVADESENAIPVKDVISRKRQTVLLSATLGHAVERLAGLTLENPIFIDAASDNTTSEILSQDTPENVVIPESVVQKYLITPPKLRLVTLSNYIISKVNKNCKMLVFMATQDMIDYHTELLSGVLTNSDSDKVIDSDDEIDESTDQKDKDNDTNMDDSSELNSDSDSENEDNKQLIDVEFFKLHGSMGQKERTDVFKTFRAAKTGVLLCTDVASRGLDLPHVDCIVQYTGPTSISDYVHRVGRTGRAGASGEAVILLAASEIMFVRELQNRRIRLKEEKLELGNVAAALAEMDNDQVTTVQEAAFRLQRRFEDTVLESKRLKTLAVKAYMSWSRFYSSYPRDMKQFFNIKNIHLGHYAKSFALKDPPSSIGGLGKRFAEIIQRKTYGNAKNKFNGKNRERDGQHGKPGRTKRLIVSEYESGLEPAKKKRKN